MEPVPVPEQRPAALRRQQRRLAMGVRLPIFLARGRRICIRHGKVPEDSAVRRHRSPARSSREWRFAWYGENGDAHGNQDLSGSREEDRDGDADWNLFYNREEAQDDEANLSLLGSWVQDRDGDAGRNRPDSRGLDRGGVKRELPRNREAVRSDPEARPKAVPLSAAWTSREALFSFS